MNKKSVIVLAFFLFFSLSLKSAQANTIPNDPHYKNQWYLNRIGFNYVWNKNFIGDDVVVAVIDSGIDINHPDLSGKIWSNKFEIKDNKADDDHNGFIDDVNGWDFVSNSSNPLPQIIASSNEDGLNHGTMISGIIGANTNNGLGISGIAQKVKIMPLKALNEKGEGKISDVIRAIDYAVNNGADIINLSFSGVGYNQGFKEAIERAYRAGVIVVAASGNNSADLDKDPLYPACFKGVNNENIIISVSATDTLDQKMSFASYGRNCVDISAPGISFFSTYFFDKENNKNKSYNGYWSGTSMSAAVISGSLALIKSTNPKLNNKELLNVLFKSSDNLNSLNPGYQDELGAGRVNLNNSVNWASEKWENLEGRFLLFPQSQIADFKTEENNFNYVRISKNKGEEESRFLAFDSSFNGSVNFAVADLNNDNNQEIIIGAGVGGGPQVRIFDSSGNLKNQFFAYDPKFRGGVNVAVGDIDGDGRKEIITGAGIGGGPHIRIFNEQGELKGQFFAYDSKFRGGVDVAVGDINGDSRAEIITGAGVGGGPHVRIFNERGELQGQFFAYENNFFGGVKVEVGNIYGDKTKDKNEIIVSPGAGRSPEIKIFNSYGQEIKKILAYSENLKSGVNLSLGDLDKDGLSEIITGAGPGGTPHVRVFDKEGGLISSFYGLESNFTGGVMVGFVEVNK
jgi:hypothetical protein